jgi:hypothetical protein
MRYIQVKLSSGFKLKVEIYSSIYKHSLYDSILLFQIFYSFLTQKYIEDSALFPPSVWAEIPSTARRTNNGPETFHAHYNEQLYACTHLCSSFWIALLKFRLPPFCRVWYIWGSLLRSCLQHFLV